MACHLKKTSSSSRSGKDHNFESGSSRVKWLEVSEFSDIDETIPILSGLFSSLLSLNAVSFLLLADEGNWVILCHTQTVLARGGL